MPSNTLRKPKSNRPQVIAALRTLLGEEFFIKQSEEFDGRTNAIWTSNETWSPAFDDQTIMNYHTLECHPKVQAILDQFGWFCEPYDPGTLFMYQN